MNILNTLLFSFLFLFISKRFRKLTTKFFSNKLFLKINNFFILFIILNIVFLVFFSSKYLVSDFYLDHVEPQIATVSWFFEYGKEIYNKTTDYERYSLIFGPITYFSNYFVMKIFGASIFSSKIISFLFINLTLLITYRTSLKITKNNKFSLFLIGLLSMILLSTVAATLRISNDSLVFFIIALSLYMCTAKKNSLANVFIFGVLITLLLNIKPNLILAILPGTFYFFLKDKSFLNILYCFIVSLILLVIIWTSKYFSIINYISWIEIISQSEFGSGFNSKMFLKNISFSLIWIIPISVLIYKDWKKINLLEKVFFYILIASSFLLSLTGSRDGAGTSELFSLVIPAIFIVSKIYNKRSFFIEKEFVGFKTIFLLLIIVVFLHSSTKGLYKKVEFLNKNNYSQQISEINSILNDYRDRKVNMGYGSNYNSYLLSYLRPLLTFNKNNFVLDVPHLVSTINSIPLNDNFLYECSDNVYIFAKNDKPFSSKYWEREIFSKKFINSFYINFYKGKTYNFFETWVCKK